MMINEFPIKICLTLLRIFTHLGALDRIFLVKCKPYL